MKFLTSVYDKESGLSVVDIKHMGRLFTGIAKLNSEDKETASEYAGCSYAEGRARIKALKYERKKLKEDAESCRKFIKACECYKNWDPSSPTARAAYRQLNRKIKKVNEITDIINQEMFELDRLIWRRGITLKAIERNKQKRLNDNSNF